MKTKILCWIGILWGGGMVFRWLARGPVIPGTAAEAGSFTAFIFGWIILGISIHNLRKEYKKKKE